MCGYYLSANNKLKINYKTMEVHVSSGSEEAEADNSMLIFKMGWQGDIRESWCFPPSFMTWIWSRDLHS